MSDRTPEENVRLTERWRRSLEGYDTSARDADDKWMDAIANAGSEPNFSGTLRRAIHRSGRPATQVAEAAGVDWPSMESFLTGAGDLPSSAIDRLIAALKMEVAMSPVNGDAA